MVGLGIGLVVRIGNPLFQTNFLPDFTHVNFLPVEVDVAPTFVQGVPALTAPKAGNDREVPTNTIETSRARDFFITKMVLSPIGFVSTFHYSGR